MDHLPREPAVARAHAGALLRARRVLHVLLAPAVLLGLAACAGSPDAPGRAAGADSAAAVTSASTLTLEPATVEQLLDTIHTAGPRATLVNVWATWCGPCREEFPELMAIRAAYRDSGVRVVLVSADFDDQADEAKQFLAAQGVDFETYLKQGEDMRFINTLHPGWSGALPATFVYDAEARLQYFHEGRFSRPELEAAVSGALRSITPRTGG